jgi:hypothetical protein
MLIHSAEITGSVQLNNTDVSAITNVAGFATTSSVNNLQSVTGSYATTGSNQFNGNQSISGSITSNGTITAQTLVVQTVTSSIEFNTGSTRNGSLLTHTHEFTGSVLMTGSLSVVTTGTELQVNAGGVNIGNALTDNHIISGSVRINPNGLFVSSSGNVGIGTTTDRTTVIGASGTGQTIGGSGTPNLTIWNTGNADWVYSTAVGNDGTVYHYNKANTDMYYYTNNIARMIIKNGGNVGIGASTSPTYKLEVSTAAGSERIRVGTLQNNNNTATFEAITSAGISTATSGWIRAVFGGGLALGTSTYTKSGGDSGNFANLSAESATTTMTINSGNVSINGVVTSASGNVTLPQSTWVTVYTFNASDIMMGIFSFTTGGTHASSTCLFNKTYNGGSGALVIGSQANQGAGTIQVSGNSIQVNQNVGAGTLGGTWWLTRLGGN